MPARLGSRRNAIERSGTRAPLPAITSSQPGWLARALQMHWLAHYRVAWLPQDFVAGVTLAAYAIPVSLAYAALAGLPPQVGVYGYLLKPFRCFGQPVSAFGAGQRETEL